MTHAMSTPAPPSPRPFAHEQPVQKNLRPLPLHGWAAAAIALGFALGAFLLRLLLDRWLADQHPFTVALGAVAIVGFIWGWRAGALCAVVSFVLADYGFVEPRGRYPLSAEELVSAIAFFALCAVLLWVSWRAHRAARETRQLVLRLQQADQHRGEFLAVLAHELRNPLGAMSSAAQVLQAGAPPVMEERAVQVLVRQIAHVSRLASDLMDASQVQEGKVTLARSHVDLMGVLHTALEVVQPQLEAKAQEARLAGPERLPAFVDERRVVQVFSNLLHNAAKFSPRGALIEIAVHSDHGRARITVTDHGVGIPRDRLEWVFDSFAQLQPRGEGLGLGLALVRKLVTLHGGTIAARSAGAGQGATFEVVLPLEGG